MWWDICGVCGQTKQYLTKQDCFANKVSNRTKTALGSNHFECDHNVNFDDVSILYFELNLHKHLFLEKLNIYNDNNSINLRDDSTTNEDISYINLIKPL